MYSAILVILAMRAFFFEPYAIPSAGMAPSYPSHSYIIISKFGYGNYGVFGSPVYHTSLSEPIRHGDAIVFTFSGVDYLKRVIGIPGDTVEYRAKKLWINGKPVVLSRHVFARQTNSTGQTINYDVFTETYGRVNWRIQNMQDMPARDFKAVVPPHKYLLMGDNRDNSRDSRYIGYVPEDTIKGRVIYPLW